VTLSQPVASQFYLLHSNGDPLAVDRILYEGTLYTPTLHSPTVLGQIDLLGVGAQDQARVYVDRYTSITSPTSTGGRFTYNATDPIGFSLEARADAWRASLDFVYSVERHITETGTLTTLEVVLQSSNF